MKLLLGSTNPAKLARLRWLLEDLPLQIQVPGGPDGEPGVEEGADSLAENAARKAAAWARQYRVAAVATDGGLVVPSLAGRWNPVLARRAAGAGATDEQRAAHLLKLAEGLRGHQRSAHQMEAAALADADGRVVWSGEGAGPREPLAHTYAPDGVPPGFWLQGVLLFSPGSRRYGELTLAERDAADGHWRALREPLRAAVRSLLTAGAP